MHAVCEQLRDRSDHLIERSRALREQAARVVTAAKLGRRYRGVSGRAQSVSAIVQAAEAEAAKYPDPIAQLVTELRAVIASEADPYLLTGALIEATACAIAKKVPAALGHDVAAAAVSQLLVRMAAHRLL